MVAMPGDYALGHWLSHYGFGFIKRGLPGTVLKPLVDYREGIEVRVLLAFLMIIFLVVSVGAVVRAIQQLLATAGSAGVWLVSFGASLAFATSPFAGNLGHLVGYFDHLLVVAMFLALACVRHERWLLAGLVGVAAMLSHELYLVVGLPSVLLACWVKLDGSGGARWLPLSKAVGLPLLGVAAIFVAAENLSPVALASLRAELMSGAALGAPAVDAATVHLAEPLAESFAAQAHEGWARLTNADVFGVTWPSFVLLLAAASALAWRRGRVACVLAVGAVVAPLGVHFVAYDHGRITGFALIGAFTAIYAAVVFAPASVTRNGVDTERRDRNWLASGVVLVVLSLASVAWTWSDPVYPIHRPVYKDGIFALRSEQAAGHPRCDRKLFDNSDFESGALDSWTLRDEGWPQGPIAAANLGNPAIVEGGYAYTTATAAERGPTKRPGRLSSREFRIDGSNINFLLDGEGAPYEVFVSLFVSGYPVRTAPATDPDRHGPVVWNVEPYRGYPANIVVVDQSTKGHVTVDRFCYAD